MLSLKYARERFFYEFSHTVHICTIAQLNFRAFNAVFGGGLEITETQLNFSLAVRACEVSRMFKQ